MQVRDKYQEFAFRINLTINLTLSLSLSQHLQISLRGSFCNFVGSPPTTVPICRLPGALFHFLIDSLQPTQKAGASM